MNNETNRHQKIKKYKIENNNIIINFNNFNTISKNDNDISTSNRKIDLNKSERKSKNKSLKNNDKF